MGQISLDRLVSPSASALSHSPSPFPMISVTPCFKQTASRGPTVHSQVPIDVGFLWHSVFLLSCLCVLGRGLLTGVCGNTSLCCHQKSDGD